MPIFTSITGSEAALRAFISLSSRCISIAARRARSASSACARGAPQFAMMASPMNLSRVPPCSNTMSTISLKYSLSSFTKSSGAMRSDIGVNPQMSLKRIATGRFSRCKS